MKRLILSGMLVILLINIGFVIAEDNITCSSDGECGEESISFPFCKNETIICTTTTFPTCNNASTNESECEDVKIDDCYLCVNGCENRACKDAEICDLDNLELCTGKNECEGVGGKWKDSECEEKDDDNETEDDDDDNETGDNSEGSGLGQTIRNRVKAGVYTSPTGEQIRVRELAQNRFLLHYNNDTAEAETELEIEEETENNQTRLKTKLSNGRNAYIKIMPGVAAERALERLRLKVCNSDNNCSIELKEVGKGEGNKTKVAYEMQIQRHERLFLLFKLKAQNKIQIDAETGEIIGVKKPWWAFLAKEVDE